MLACALLIPLLAASSVAATNQPLVSDAQQYIIQGFAENPGFNIDLHERRLVQFEGAEPVWITELDKIQAKMHGLRFFDVTDTPDLAANAHTVAFSREAFPKPNATDLVKSVIDTLSIDGPVENLQKFTSFRTRHYRSDTGRQSQQWLLKRINDITTEYASKSLAEVITISEFPHSWGQNSIIVRINGSSSDSVVIASAHQDSTNLLPFLAAPGADDDGSGSVTILEAYRGLIASGFRPERTVEFHWYSAEEAGLLGSQAIAKDYQRRAVEVYAQIQFDMTAWIKKGTREEVGIMTDFVDPDLTEFLRQLVKKYIDIPFVDTKCGYGCSDHASWNKAGYRSSCSFESAFENDNSHVHSGDDRIDVSDEFSFPHLLHFSKIAAAFAIELGGWKQ